MTSSDSVEMKLGSLIITLATSAFAAGPIPVTRSGLAGIDGFYFYNPYCAHGCFRSFSSFLLACSQDINPGGHTTASAAAHNLALCRASDFPYLSSIAWCINEYCPKNVEASTIEKFWETEITGNVNILPKWSYGETIAQISQPPTKTADVLHTTLVLNTTMLTTYSNWESTWITLYFFFRETSLESYFGLSLCLTEAFLPVVLGWLGFIRLMPLSRIKPYLYPSIIKNYHDRPLPYLVGNAPTVGQSLFIIIVVALNFIFFSVGYRTAYPTYTFQWYTDRYQELMAYWMWRTGVLAFANMPVLFLFSSRNSFLLWATNWSHSTYMLLHRWIARLFLLQCLLHSILALVLYTHTGSYAKSLKTSWWIWGCVATIAAVVLILTSFLAFRRLSYELFLVPHVVMSVVCVAGCWYHVYIGYENTFGYETWLYATIAVWFFDRLTRLTRIMNSGIRRAEVTNIGSNIVRVDVSETRWATPGRCVYVYFPTSTHSDRGRTTLARQFLRAF